MGDPGLWVMSRAPNAALGSPVGDAPVAGRVCAAPGFGDINETIVDYDATIQSLTFEATASKIPGFVKHIRNRLQVVSASKKKALAKAA